MKALVKWLRSYDIHAIGAPPMHKAADALERLTSGDVELPEPLYTNKHRAYADSYSQDQLIDYGNRRVAAAVLAERERLKGGQL